MSDLCANYNATDPDISGPGVRISFYLQTFLLVLLVDRSWEEAPIALWTFIAMSFGLTIAAIIQRDSLTLFQALQVSNLVWMANFGTFIALASYSRQKGASRHKRKPAAADKDPSPVRNFQNRSKEEDERQKSDYGVKYGAMIQTIFSMALTLYMWAAAKSFGPSPSPQCPNSNKDIIFAIFVIKALALGRGKSAGLAISSILMALYTLITLHELFYRTRQRKKAKDNPSPKKLSMKSSSPNAASAIPATLTGRVAIHTERIRARRRSWTSPLDPMLIGITICQVLIFTYFIVSIELLIRYNNSKNGASFSGFGQILALVLVLPSLLSVIGAFREHGLARHTGNRQRDNSRRPSDAADLA